MTPPTSAVGVDTDLVATATYTEQGGATRSTHTRQPLMVAFDPGKYPDQQVVDDFVRSAYHVMFGLRGDGGTIAVSRFEARSSGGVAASPVKQP